MVLSFKKQTEATTLKTINKELTAKEPPTKKIMEKKKGLQKVLVKIQSQ